MLRNLRETNMSLFQKPPPRARLGAAPFLSARGFFPHIHKDFKEKSLTPCRLAGILYCKEFEL
jgi:hypothetical protein